MDLSAINTSGAVVAALACFVSGFIWFGPKTLFPVWWRAMGKTEADVPGQGQHMGLVFGLTTIAALLQGFVLSLLLGNVVPGDATLVQGAAVGAVTGIAVVLPALGHRLFAGHTLKVWALECGNDLLNFILMGVVLSFFQ